MRHIEQHHSQHAPPQLFDLVVDVERYPDFLPWVISARVTRRETRTMWTDLTMGVNLFRKQFVTVAFLDRPHRIEVTSRDPIFECFDQIWTFEPAITGGTMIEYRVHLRFRSQILQTLIGASFADRAEVMVKAFVRRAQRLYGTPQPVMQDEQRSI
jgi:coenzyme Q-binding protein COQ10